MGPLLPPHTHTQAVALTGIKGDGARTSLPMVRPRAMAVRARGQGKKGPLCPRPGLSLQGPRGQRDTGSSFPLAQKLLPQTDGRSGDPQSHLGPLRRLERVLAEERVLPALRQREHRHLRAGDGQARRQVAPRLRLPAGAAEDRSGRRFYFLSGERKGALGGWREVGGRGCGSRSRPRKEPLRVIFSLTRASVLKTRSPRGVLSMCFLPVVLELFKKKTDFILDL